MGRDRGVTSLQRPVLAYREEEPRCAALSETEAARDRGQRLECPGERAKMARGCRHVAGDVVAADVVAAGSRVRDGQEGGHKASPDR